MDKQKKWPLVLILSVVALTIYNILPTIFYYAQPLKSAVCEEEGMKVVGIKSLGYTHGLQFTSLPPYESYRLAMQAAREFPECDFYGDSYIPTFIYQP